MPKRIKIGKVVSNKMDKTAVVITETLVPHRLYKKTLCRTTKYMVHDEENACQPGDKVRIVETRPLSKNKRWRLLEVIEKAK